MIDVLKELVKRNDMKTDPFFRAFFEMDTHIPGSICYTPRKIAECANIPLGVRDFVYLEQY